MRRFWVRVSIRGGGVEAIEAVSEINTFPRHADSPHALGIAY